MCSGWVGRSAGLLLVAGGVGCASSAGYDALSAEGARFGLAAPSIERFDAQVEPGAAPAEESRTRALFLSADALHGVTRAEGGAGAAGGEPAGASPAPDGTEPPDGTAPPETKPLRRLRVYTARFELLVANVEASLKRFVERVEELGGYLEKRTNESVTCRVPALRFKEVTEELRGYGLVTSESTEALDVTKQYFDLQIRIENAETARERLLALLERAERVEDALKIESELRRLSEEIDRLKGELQFLSERIAYSTIQVLFRSSAPPPRAIPQRTRSRFEWVNQVGVEHVLTHF